MIASDEQYRAEIRALYATFGPGAGPALCRWALGPPGARGGATALRAATPAARRLTCTRCGRDLQVNNHKGVCSDRAACRDRAAGRATPGLVCGRCGRALHATNRTGVCGNTRACQARVAATGRPAASAPAPSAPAITATLPVAPARRPACCPASADGRHKLARFGGLPLPGQPVDYCAECEPRDPGARRNWFAPGR